MNKIGMNKIGSAGFLGSGFWVLGSEFKKKERLTPLLITSKRPGRAT
jgi:hypothetical protein